MRHVRDITIDPGENPDRWRQLLRQARVPERYWCCTAEAIEDEVLRSWLTSAESNYPQWAQMGAGFYLHGPFESGKSSIAAIIMMHLIRRCETCLWVSARDVPSMIFTETDEWKRVNARLRKCDLLVIDDFGSQNVRMEGPGGTAFESAMRIMYDRKRSVFMTANWEWEFLHTKYASTLEALISIIDRLMTPIEVVNDQWGKARRG